MNAMKKLFAGHSPVSTTVKLAVGAGAMVGMAASQAAIDTTSIVSTISDGTTAVGVIAAAALAVVALVKVYKLVRAAM